MIATGLKMTWTGWDGSVWDLTNATSGIFITKAGLRGLGMPTHERWSREAPLVPGSTHLGHRVKDRDVFWPLAVFHDVSSAAFVTREQAFWKTMDPDKPGTWTVTLPSGEKRSLKLRFVDDSNHAVTHDPVLKGWDTYGLHLVADDPYWTTGTVGQTVESAEQPGRLITNTGEIDTFPQIWLRGPLPTGATARWGSDASKFVRTSGDTPAGKMVVVDCRPTRRWAKEIDAPAEYVATGPTVTNRVPNPSFENSASDGTVLTGASIASVARATGALGPAEGLNFLAITGAASPTSAAATVYEVAQGPFVTGEWFAAAFKARRPAGSADLFARVHLSFRDAANAQVGAWVNAWSLLTTEGLSSEAARLSHAVQVPAGAASVWVILQFAGSSGGANPPASFVAHSDAWIAVTASSLAEATSRVTSYFDGSKPDDANTAYRWVGTPHASASTKVPAAWVSLEAMAAEVERRVALPTAVDRTGQLNALSNLTLRLPAGAQEQCFATWFGGTIKDSRCWFVLTPRHRRAW